MSDINRYIISGEITGKVHLDKTKPNDPILKFQVTTNEHRGSKKEPLETAHNCMIKGRGADGIELRDGDLVMIEGKFRRDKFGTYLLVENLV